MTKRKQTLDSALESMLVEEIELIREKDESGKFMHSTTERMKVFDRALKLKALNQKEESPNWGSAFKDKE